MTSLTSGFATIRSRMNVRRIFIENDGVEGCGYFHRRSEQAQHFLGNILRLIVTLAIAPIYLLIPRVLVRTTVNYLQSNWLKESADTHDSVLTTAKSDGATLYEVMAFRPRWVIEVVFDDPLENPNSGTTYVQYQRKQIDFTDDIRHAGYTALSYPFPDAVQLAENNGFPKPQQPKQKYSLKDRLTISTYVLDLYLNTAGRGRGKGSVEYIWFDEWCLSQQDGWGTQSDREEYKLRESETGRIADIFRGASRTVIFCYTENCTHTGLDCPWGQRLWTLAEILHADTVLSMTMKKKPGGALEAHIGARTAGRDFRADMQANAARGDRWHLYSIFQHSINAGSVPWQVAIHALVVEAIRRDDYDIEYQDHDQLGRGLNGLLPRRARTRDLNQGGWKDLAWLLELNQGFYNAASLAAVCSLADKGKTVSWMGKPINPAAGNERLEPVVSAFPVSRAGYSEPQLSIIGCETIGLRPHPVKRDAYGLYNNREMRFIMWLAIVTCVAVVIIAFVSTGIETTLLVAYIASMAYCLVEMLVSTMYLERMGWAFLEDSIYGARPELKLVEQDPHLRALTYWGDRQLVPRWETPPRREYYTGSLVDLCNRVCVRAAVVDRPNAVVPLAIHGSGATCMLLKRPQDGDKDATYFAQKVGMCSMPPYIFAQAAKSGTIFVGDRVAREENINKADANHFYNIV